MTSVSYAKPYHTILKYFPFGCGTYLNFIFQIPPDNLGFAIEQEELQETRRF